MNLIDFSDLIAVQIEDVGHLRIPLRLLIHHINSTQSFIHNLVANSENDLTIATETIDPIEAGTTLPVDFLRVRDVSVNGCPIELIQPQQRHVFSATVEDVTGIGSSSYFAYLRGNKIFFSDGLASGTGVTFTYTRRLPKLHRGVPQAASSTTVTLADEALIGSVETKDDYYKNATIVGMSGPGAGEEHVFSGYVGSTKIGTTDEWDEPLTTASVYEIKCELPEDPDFHVILCDIVSDKLGKGKGNKQVWAELEQKLGQLSSRNSQNGWFII